MFDDSLHHHPGDSKQRNRKESQKTRKQSLEICGIPVSAYASSEDALLKIPSTLVVTMSAEVINISHRVKRNETCTFW